MHYERERDGQQECHAYSLSAASVSCLAAVFLSWLFCCQSRFCLAFLGTSTVRHLLLLWQRVLPARLVRRPRTHGPLRLWVRSPKAVSASFGLVMSCTLHLVLIFFCLVYLSALLLALYLE